MHYLLEVQIPQLIEEMTGEIVRWIQREYEQFEIEKSKLRLRIAKMMKRYENHVKETDECLNYENTIRIKRLDDFEYNMHKIINEENKRENEINDYLFVSDKEFTQLLSNEIEGRNNADLSLINTVFEDISNLQDTIKKYYGLHDDMKLPSLNDLRKALKREKQQKIEEEKRQQEELLRKQEEELKAQEELENSKKNKKGKKTSKK